MTDLTRVYGGISATERRNDRREKLLVAAFDLLASDGTQALTIRKIAAAAGVSPRYVYEDFSDLEDLACQAFDSAAEEIGAIAVDAAATAGVGDARGQLTAVLGALFDYTVTHPAKARLILTDAYGDPVLAARRLTMSKVFARGFSFYVGSYVADADLSQASIDLTARAIVGAVGEIAAAWVSGSLPYDKQTIVDHEVEFILGAITALSERGPSKD